MSEDQAFIDGDIVWVKLGNNWWPGEVIGDEARLPEEVGHLKKKPYCVVKFFQEDAYEYAKNPRQVFPFQCPKKDEFIKKGLARYNAKNAFMEKFPEDVKHAESLTNPQQSTITTKIINNSAGSIVKPTWGQGLTRTSVDGNDSIQHRAHSNISSTSNGKFDDKDSSNQSILRRDSMTKILNISLNRASLGSTAATPMSTPPSASATASRTLSNSSSASITPNSVAISSSCPYRCNMCDFTTTRQNVLIMHRKSHTSSSGSGSGVGSATFPPSSSGLNKSQPSGSLIVTLTSDKASTGKDNCTTSGSRRSTATPVTAKHEEKLNKSLTSKALKNLDVSSTEPTSVSPTVESSIEKRNRRKTVASPAMSKPAKTPPSTTNRRSTRTSRSTPQISSASPASEDVSSSDISSTKTEITVVPADDEKITTDETQHCAMIQQRLLADWSDEDKDEEVGHLKKALKEKSQEPLIPSSTTSTAAVLHLSTTNSKTTQLRRRSPTIVPLKTLEGAGQTLVMTTTSSPPTITKTTPQRIRNIPKKDRLRDFEKSVTTDDEHTTTDNKSTQPPIVVLESEKNSATTDNTVETVTTLTTTDIKPPMAETSTSVNTTSASTESFSCFDFQDEEESENDVLKSIANFKKKYYSPEKDKAHPSSGNNEQSSPGKPNAGAEAEQRDMELSAEIDNLLEQTTSTSTQKEEAAGTGTVSVKGLPIKERGKRIFKSRNRSRVEDEDVPQSESANEAASTVPITTDEIEKTKDESISESLEETITTPTSERKTRGRKSKRQTGKEPATSPSSVNGKADKNHVVVNPIAPTSLDTPVLESITESALVPQRSKRKPYNHRIMRQNIEDEEASIPFISHSPVELFNCESTLDNSICARMPATGRRSKTATPNSVLASREENQNGGSRASSRSLNAPTEDSSSFGVSEAGAEFGSPASSLDEERVLTPRSEIEKSTTVIRGDKTAVAVEADGDGDDDDDIESPPHEALSGNELENETEKTVNKKPKTPKKKSNTKENSKLAEQQTVALLIGRRKLRAETESPSSDDMSRIESPKTPQSSSDTGVPIEQSVAKIEKGEDGIKTTTARNSSRKIISTNEKAKKSKTPIKDNIKEDVSKLVDKVDNGSKIVDSAINNIQLAEISEKLKSPERKSITENPKQSPKHIDNEISPKGPIEKESMSNTEDNEAVVESPKRNIENVEELSKSIAEIGEQKIESKIPEAEKKNNDSAALELELTGTKSVIDIPKTNKPITNSILDNTHSDSKKLEENSPIPTNDVQGKKSTTISETENKVLQEKNVKIAEEKESIEEQPIENKSKIEETKNKSRDKLDTPKTKDQIVKSSSNINLETHGGKMPTTASAKNNKDLALKKQATNSKEKTKTDTSTVIDTKETLKDSPKTPKTDVTNSNVLSSATGVESIEKVRINVDVANPLSSQIANILASSGSSNTSQQHQLSAANKIKSSQLKTSASSLKRKHSQDEITSNDGDDVVAHVQSLCPQVKITRKERIIEPSLSPKMSDSGYDISQMPILLSNDQILAQKPETPMSVANLWQTDILQPPLTPTKSDDERQTTPQKKIGFDSRGQKYVVLGASTPTIPSTINTEDLSKNLSPTRSLTADSRNSLAHSGSPTILQSSQSSPPQKSPAGSTGGRKQAGNTITIPSSLTVKQHQHKFVEALALADSVLGLSSKPTKRRSSQSIPSTSSSGNGTVTNTSRRLSSAAAINVQSPPPAKIQKTLSTDERLKSSPSKFDNSGSISKTWSQSHRHTQKQKKMEPTSGGGIAAGSDSESIADTTSGTTSNPNPMYSPQLSPSVSTSSNTKVVPSEDNQMVTEAEHLNSTAKITAVPIQPIPGYAETFLLCMLVNNTYKPINNIPHYLNTDLNQLVPVPPKAYEGMLPELIVDQPPTPSVDSDVENGATTLLGSNSTASGSTLGGGNKLQMSARESEETIGMDDSEMKSQLQSSDASLSGNDAIAVESESGDGGGEASTDNAIVLNLNDQQIILDASTFEQLLANPDANTQLVTDDGTEFVLTREVLAALKAQHDEQNVELLAIPAEQGPDSETGSSGDLLSVALANSEFYGNDVLQIETTLGGAGSAGLQFLASDGSIVFQAPPLPQAHLTPPITAHTSETNAVLNQTPIMSTLEKPSTGVVPGKGGIVTPAATNVESNMPGMRPNLDDSLAVIGVSTQSSTVPSSLELPITITNPAIAPKVTMAASAHGADLVQFQPRRSVATASVVAVVAAATGAGMTHIYDDPMEGLN